MQIIRYADDLVVLTKRAPEQFMKILRDKLGELELNMKETKTRILRADEDDFDFRGFNVRMIWNKQKTKKFPYILPSKWAVQSVKSRIKEITKPTSTKATDIVKEINPELNGWMNYFRHENAATVFENVHRYAMDSIRKFIRRNQKKCGYGRNIITDKIVTEFFGLVKPLKIEYLRG